MHKILCISLFFFYYSLLFAEQNPDIFGSNISDLCAESGENSVKSYLKNIYTVAKDQWSEKQLVNFITNIDKKNLGTYAWILSMSQHQKFRHVALQVQLYAMKLLLKKFETHSEEYNDLTLWHKVFSAAKHPAPYSSNNIEIMKKKFSQLSQNRFYNKKLNSLKVASPLLCKNIACITGLKKTINYTNPKNLSYGSGKYAISFQETLQDILSMEQFQQGLAVQGLKVLEYLQDIRDKNHHYLKDKFLYSDLLDSFISSGLTHHQAHTMTMSILGIYGSRGASIQFLEYYADKDNVQTLLLMQFIFVATSYLDIIKRSLNTDSLYTLPASIKTSCDFGKPYHFWMSAYLQHILKKSAISGIHLMGNLYEAINKSTLGRENLYRPFLDELYSATNHSIRAGIVFRDLGLLWSLNYPSNQNYHADEDLFELTQKSKKLSAKKVRRLLKGANALKTYYAWRKMFASDYVLEKYLDQ